jgi:hypothetical protein
VGSGSERGRVEIDRDGKAAAVAVRNARGVTMKANENLEPVLERLRAFLPELQERHAVNTLEVFGSRVREDAHEESDLDILVTFTVTPGLFVGGQHPGAPVIFIVSTADDAHRREFLIASPFGDRMTNMGDRKTRQLAGIVLLVVGVLLLFFGWQATGSMGEQMHETFMGRYSDQTMWYLIGGAASAVGGLFLLLTGR